LFSVECTAKLKHCSCFFHRSLDRQKQITDHHYIIFYHRKNAYKWIFPDLDTRKTQRFLGSVVTNHDDHSVGDAISDHGYGHGCCGHPSGCTSADRPVKSNDTVAGETFVVVNAPERFRGGRFEVFEKRVQDDNRRKQSLYHIQGEQGKPEETGKVFGEKREKSHENLGDCLG